MVVDGEDASWSLGQLLVPLLFDIPTRHATQRLGAMHEKTKPDRGYAKPGGGAKPPNSRSRSSAKPIVVRSSR